MKLIHHGGYTESERESYKEIIFSNTIQSMRYVPNRNRTTIALLTLHPQRYP